MTDLRGFIDRAREIGELRTIEGADWQSEVGALSFSVCERDNPPALLFDKIKDYPPGYRILTIPCSTTKRMALLCGLPVESTKLELVQSIRKKMAEEYSPVPPMELRHGPVLENVQSGDQVDLFKFPTPQWQPMDGGRYIGTGDNVIMRDPDEGWVNVGVYRVQIHSKNVATIFIEPGRHGDIIRKKYWARGQSCPVVVTCGGDLMLFNFGTIRVPWGVSEFDYTGWWQNEPLKIVKGPATGLPIPADAEIALEGELMPPGGETVLEGPFSEYTGHYAPARREPVFRVKNVLHRNNPILLGVLPYLTPRVPYFANFLWRAAHVWSELDHVVPGVKGVWIAPDFGGNRTVVVSLAQKYGGHAKQAGLAALAVRGYMQRYVIIVDDDVDPTDLPEVLWAVAYRAEPGEFQTVHGFWGGMLDPRLPPDKRAKGDFTMSSAIILACKPFHFMNNFPPQVRPDREVRQRVREKFGKLAL